MTDALTESMLLEIARWRWPELPWEVRRVPLGLGRGRTWGNDRQALHMRAD